MTQKERDELQHYLDERIFGTKRQMRSKCADKQLTQGQKDFLYLIVRDVGSFDAKNVQNTNDLDVAIIKVAYCLRQINFHGMKPNPKNSKNIVPRDKMPFLVKQVLWLICYKALEAGLKQKDVFEEFHQHNIYVSHNFFSSLEQTPDYFLRCEEYSQPENPCKYKGQKKEELGMAIKRLVYQAGKHSYFVDIFGGSGSASAAVCRKRRVKYVYNEKNRTVCNYVGILKSDDYKKVIEGLQSIQDDLLSSDITTYSFYKKFDMPKEIGKYINSKRAKTQKDSEIIDLEREIQGYADVNFNIDQQRLAELMKQFPSAIMVFRNEIEELLKEKEIFRGISSFDDLVDLDTVGDFYRYEDDFYYLLRLGYLQTWGLSFVKGMYGFDEITYDEWRKMFRQYKALGYYAYFYLRRGNTRDAVAHAIGEIYLQYFSVQGSIVSSAIIYDQRSTIWNEPYYAIYNFLEEDFVSKVEKFHKALSGTIIENGDFRDIIKNYEFKNTLFYSDSPYIATSDYNEGEYLKFHGDDMKDLIRMLMQGSGASKAGNTQKASKPNKFIFSMRAVKSAEEKGASDKIVSGNRQIYESVYKEFAPYAKSLYVLAIFEEKEKEKEDEELCTLIQDNKVIEIMITNYEIVSFEVETKGKRYTCKALKFNVYMKKIRKYMKGYNKSWDV